MSAPADRSSTDHFVFLHGFTQTHHHWHSVALGVAAAVRTPPRLSFVDLPGHGLSIDDTSNIEETAGRLPDLVGPGTYVGYSMGARVALLSAAGGVPAIERLVLIGGTAGIEDDHERDERAAADDQRAQYIETVGPTTFVDEWLSQPMFAGLPPDPDGLAHRRRNTSAGLAHSLRTGGTGNQPSVWHLLDRIEIPVLVIAGDLDRKFIDIGTRMVDRLAGATLARVPDAGHAAHTERPEAVIAAIAEWADSS